MMSNRRLTTYFALPDIEVPLKDRDEIGLFFFGSKEYSSDLECIVQMFYRCCIARVARGWDSSQEEYIRRVKLTCTQLPLTVNHAGARMVLIDSIVGLLDTLRLLIIS